MEYTTVRYRDSEHRPLKGWSGPWRHVEGGVVLISENSQTFIPWHRIYDIEQTFTSGVVADEKVAKSLAHRMRRA